MNIQNELLLNYKEKSNFIGYEKLGSKTYIQAIVKALEEDAVAFSKKLLNMI